MPITKCSADVCVAQNSQETHTFLDLSGQFGVFFQTCTKLEFRLHHEAQTGTVLHHARGCGRVISTGPGKVILTFKNEGCSAFSLQLLMDYFDMIDFFVNVRRHVTFCVSTFPLPPGYLPLLALFSEVTLTIDQVKVK